MLYLLTKPLQTMTSLCSKKDIQALFLKGMRMSLNPLDIALPIWLLCSLLLPVGRSFLWELPGNSVTSLDYSYYGAPENHLTIALGPLYPFSNFELPSAMHAIHKSSLLPVIFCTALMPSFKNFSWYMFQQGNPFLFSSAVKNLKKKNLSILL